MLYARKLANYITLQRTYIVRVLSEVRNEIQRVIRNGFGLMEITQGTEVLVYNYWNAITLPLQRKLS